MSKRPGPAETVPQPARPRLLVVPRLEDELGANALALPGELALLLRVALPLNSHRARLAAVAFAVEDLIAEPLEAVHVVLGPELGPGEYLAVVVRRAAMVDWAAQAHRAGARLVPDVLAVPVPHEGSWSVREIAGRVLVRTSDGTGFATGLDAFETFWRAAAAPQVVLYGGRLPETVPTGATGLQPPAPSEEAARFDLLQGPFARSGAGGRRIGLRLAAVVAVALVAHGVVLAAETFALRRIAEERAAELRAELALRVPDLPASVPLDVALRAALPVDAAVDGSGGFLTLLSGAATVLEPFGGDVALRTLGYGAGDGALTLTVEAPDLATLQRIEAELAAAGMVVQAGAATTGDGLAEVSFQIRGPGA